MSEIAVVRDVAALRGEIGAWRAAGSAVGLVPTMGALHEGHLALVRRALDRCGRVCATLFVNPRQFGPNEDFARYPRDEAGDVRLLAHAGAHLLFAPAVEVVYPPGDETRISVGRLGEMLEGEFRAGFFTGVATVVAKLLLQAQPDAAFFGEKDYQQLLVVRRLVRDLQIPVEIVGVPTVREKDGLALSSRNAYLTAAERAVAPALARVLTETAGAVLAGTAPAEAERAAVAALTKAGFARVDYVAVRDAETLEANPPSGRPRRVLAAAWLGQTRLIDNAPV
ncbi:MAG: pantoate--beta-alanine ligase [Alphaproteobacteria bacterium]|nr:pantoate--beta-alanine ligase [Alphaproteobacteria bacterium]